MRDWNNKKIVVETLKQLEYERAKIHNKFSKNGFGEQALNALINEKFLSLIYNLEDIKGEFVNQEKFNELNLAYDELIKLINNPNNYSKEDSIHKDVYALILKVNEFYMFYKNDFRLSYNSVVDLIINKSNTIVQYKSEIINEFERFLRELIELNEIVKRFKLNQKVSIEIFYNYLCTLVEKKDFIDFKLFNFFYQNLIINKLEIISNSIRDIENYFNKLKKIKNVTEENLVDFIFETYSTIILFEELFQFNNSKNTNIIENNLFEAKFYFNIKTQIWWIKQKITEFNDLKNISNRDDLIKGVYKFYLSLKNKKFKNTFYGYIYIRGSYYLLDFLVKDLRNNSNNLNLILENNNSVLIFIEEFLKNVELEFKNINISSEVDDDKIKKIVEKYYKEFQSNKYQFLNFSFEDPDENLEFTFEEPKVNKKIPPKKNDSLFGFDFTEDEENLQSDEIKKQVTLNSDRIALNSVKNNSSINKYDINDLNDFITFSRTKMLKYVKGIIPSYLKPRYSSIDKNSSEYDNILIQIIKIRFGKEIFDKFLENLPSMIYNIDNINIDELNIFKEMVVNSSESVNEIEKLLRIKFKAGEGDKRNKSLLRTYILLSLKYYKDKNRTYIKEFIKQNFENCIDLAIKSLK